MDSIKKLIKYYIVFFKIGLFTIGGGYVMIPIMEKELVDKKEWITPRQVATAPFILPIL